MRSVLGQLASGNGHLLIVAVVVVVVVGSGHVRFELVSHGVLEEEVG